MTHQIDRNAQAALVRAAASFVRDTYSGEWADDAAATLETDADLIERGEPCSLLRLAEAMQPAAVSAVVEPPADETTPSHRAGLRDHIAGALIAWTYRGKDPDPETGILETVRANAYSRADAVLVVLYREWPWLRAEAEDAAPPADRATVYREAADALGRMDYDTDSNDYGYDTYRDAWNGGVMDAADRLRRMVDETATTQTQPRRGDRFEQWLKTQRDKHRDDNRGRWSAYDDLLDLYRLHADTGTPLGEHVCEARVVGDCECLEQPAAGARQDGSQP